MESHNWKFEQDPAVLFTYRLKALLSESAWWIVFPHEPGDPVLAHRRQNAPSEDEDNSVTGVFTSEMLIANGMTDYKDDYVQAAKEAIPYLVSLIKEKDTNRNSHTLQFMARYIRKLRPEWTVSFRESASIGDWVEITMAFKGFRYTSSFNTLDCSILLDSMTPEEILEGHSSTWYYRHAEEIVSRVEKEARRARRDSMPKRGLMNLFAA